MLYFLKTRVKDDPVDFWFAVAFRLVLVLWFVALVIAIR